MLNLHGLQYLLSYPSSPYPPPSWPKSSASIRAGRGGPQGRLEWVGGQAHLECVGGQAHLEWVGGWLVGAGRRWLVGAGRRWLVGAAGG